MEFKFVQFKDHAFFQGQIISIKRNYITFKNLLLKNHLANFNQAWHRVSLGTFERKGHIFLQRVIIANLENKTVPSYRDAILKKKILPLAAKSNLNL